MIELQSFRHDHPVVLFVVIAVWAWISLSLVIRMWLLHRRVGAIKKLFWSLVLVVPVVGWIFYGAFFRPPSISAVRAPEEHSRDAYAGAFGPGPP